MPWHGMIIIKIKGTKGKKKKEDSGREREREREVFCPCIRLKPWYRLIDDLSLHVAAKTFDRGVSSESSSKPTYAVVTKQSPSPSPSSSKENTPPKLQQSGPSSDIIAEHRGLREISEIAIRFLSSEGTVSCFPYTPVLVLLWFLC